MMTSPQLDHMTNVYVFVSTPINAITTKLEMIVEEHPLMLANM